MVVQWEEGLRIRSWQRDETRMESLGVEVEKKHGYREETQTRKRHNERLLYAVSSSVVTLHYEKKNPKQNTKAEVLTRLVIKHNDLRERERERENHEVELRAWL